ncbi:MAG: hypothetical protein HY820_44035 [Acidobacteria bacterium]|nr:hypothetical protein [Acidobacteriota bacterium]
MESLLCRTTRNVAPTEAGQEILVSLRPAFTDIEDALDKISRLRDKPIGRVRLVTPRLAAMTVLAPLLKRFAHDYPDIVLDVTTDESPMDIAAGGCDAAFTSGNTGLRRPARGDRGFCDVFQIQDEDARAQAVEQAQSNRPALDA